VRVCAAGPAVWHALAMDDRTPPEPPSPLRIECEIPGCSWRYEEPAFPGGSGLMTARAMLLGHIARVHTPSADEETPPRRPYQRPQVYDLHPRFPVVVDGTVVAWATTADWALSISEQYPEGSEHP
jgi:hypothetical protein